MPVLEEQRCKEQSGAKFCINSFFFPSMHSWSCIMNLIQSGGLMDGTIGDVNSAQRALCCCRGQCSFYYITVMSVKKDQGRLQGWVM